MGGQIGGQIVVKSITQRVAQYEHTNKKGT